MESAQQIQGRPEDVKQREMRPALSAQLERTDRAVRSWVGLEAQGVRRGVSGISLSPPGSRPGLDYSQAAGVSGEGWGGGIAPFRPLSGGEQLWAEQADRAFRRDSRRYDGGFYLY